MPNRGRNKAVICLGAGTLYYLYKVFTTDYKDQSDTFTMKITNCYNNNLYYALLPSHNTARNFIRIVA